MAKPQTDFETVLDATTVPTDSDAPYRPFPVDRLLLDLVDRMEAVEADWRRLEQRPGNSLHQAYDWCHAWQAAHDHPLIIVRGRIDGRTVMLLPLEAVHARGGTIARFIGNGYNNINTGLLAEDLRYLDGEAVQAIAARLASLLRGHADLVLLETVPLIWRDVAHPLTGLHAIESTNHTFQLPLLETFEATLAQINAKRRRKKFRVQQKRLDEKGGYEHFIPSTPGEKHALLDLFFTQKAERFRAHGLPDTFRFPQVRAFLHALLDAPPHENDTPLELHAIRLKGVHDGRIAAISGLSRKGDHVICQFGSIDDTLVPEASPGELLFWLMIERACRTGAVLFDFGLGDQPYKRSWCTIETVMHDLMLPISLRGRAMMQIAIHTQGLKSAIKRNKPLYAFLQKLRAGRQTPPVAATETD